MRTPSDDVTVRAGEDTDIPDVVELMRNALGEGKIPRTREFWTWKHRRNPFGASPMWLAFSAERLVGVRIFLRWRFRAADGALEAVRAVDTATLPSFQGKGIFKRLTLGLVDEMKRAGVKFVFNTPNAKSRPGYLKMGWTSLGRSSLWVRARRPGPLLARLAGARRRDPFQSALSPAAPLALINATSSVLLAGNGNTSIRTPLSHEYLRWRYAECPAASYAGYSDDPTRSLVITRLRERDGLQELAISELVFERSLSGARSGIASLRQALRAQPSDYAIAALRNDPLEACIWAACGFLPAPSAGPIVTVRDLAANAPAGGLHPRGLQTSIGDLELF